ncbi:MAG: hypothetical protein C0167_02165 [Nitrososphaera sp.]|nr:MAG: hypothetical protein C0167_02165 [Nitrososphaera sp.]
MSFVNSTLVGTGTAITYQIVDTLAQYTNTKQQLTSFITNGEIVMVSVGVIMLGVAYWAWNSGRDVIAAVGVELGPLLLVSGILDAIKRRLSKVPQLAQVAQVKAVRPVAAAAPAATTVRRVPFTPMD